MSKMSKIHAELFNDDFVHGSAFDPTIRVGDLMHDVMTWAKLYIVKMQRTPNDHHDVYHAVCTRFNMYNERGSAPVWLSRAIDGLLRDVANGEIDDDQL